MSEKSELDKNELILGKSLIYSDKSEFIKKLSNLNRIK